MLALTSIGVVLLSVAYPPSRDQIGIVPPLPVGGQVATSGGSGAGVQGEPGNGLLTVTGAAVLTQWGTVQVQIVVQDGRILQARGVRYPNLNLHGQALNGAAVPALNYQAVARQSAHLDTVSGATITSAGYIGSLQSAIDQAHL